MRSPPAVNGCFIDIPGGDQEISEVFKSVFGPCKKESYTKHWQILEDRVEEKCWVKVPAHEVLGSLKCVFILRCFRMHKLIHKRI